MTGSIIDEEEDTCEKLSFGVFTFPTFLRTLRSRVFDRKEALLSSGACSAQKTESFALKIRENGQNPAERFEHVQKVQKVKNTKR